MRKFLFISVMLLSASMALAAESGGASKDGFSVDLPNLLEPLLGKNATIQTLIDKVIPIIATLAATIAGLMIVVGAFKILMAGGDPQKFESGKKTILYAVVGLAIVLLSRLIITVVSELVGK